MLWVRVPPRVWPRVREEARRVRGGSLVAQQAEAAGSDWHVVGSNPTQRMRVACDLEDAPVAQRQRHSV